MTQKEALEILKMGHSVFLTGSAGSGKTYLLNQYIDYLKKHEVEVAITASTGIAATHMNGMTIHSWSGLGVRDNITDRDIEELEEKKYLWSRFQNVKVLIIDEVSMLHHFRLDMVEKIVRSFKRNNKPFGGMQVILCGDFFQLPPVSRAGEPEAHFVFHSKTWQEMNPVICYLEEQHRQVDGVAIKVLNDIRSNSVNEKTKNTLLARLNKDVEVPALPVVLYTHNADVDRINEEQLEMIDAPVRVYEMEESGGSALVASLKKSCLALEELKLKIGARVMFVKNNFEQGYVNGTLGEVIAFDDLGPVVRTTSGKEITAYPMSWVVEEDGKVKAKIEQVPLRLAWAITVHKSQGMSLDAVAVDLSRSFEKGMGYVALSRVRTLSGLKLLGINENALSVNDEVLVFDMNLRKRSDMAKKRLALLSSDDKRVRVAKHLKSVVPTEKEKEQKISTHDKTASLLSKKMSIKEMAKERGLTESTILSHLEELLEEGKIDQVKMHHLRPAPKRFQKIRDAFLKVEKETGDRKLAPVRDILGNSFDFDELRLARMFL